MLAAAEQAARSLLGLGLRPGDRVGILMPNCLDFVELQFGCALLGVPFVPINVRYRAHELAYVLRTPGMVAVVTNDLIASTWTSQRCSPSAVRGAAARASGT